MARSTKLFTSESVTEGHPDKMADQGVNSRQARIRAIEKKALPVLRKAGVRRAALFGSVVSGNFRRASDVDLLIDFRGRKSLLDFIGLKQDLEETLGRKVDLVTYRSLHPLLRDRILKQQLQIL